MRRSLLFTSIICVFAACDVVAPNRPESVSATTPSGLRLSMTLEPASINAFGSFDLRLSLMNVSSRELGVSATAPRISGDSAPSFAGEITFVRNGQSAVFQTRNAPCTVFMGKLINERTYAVAKPGQELFYLGECNQGFRALQTTPAGEYTVTFTHSARVDSPTPEILPPLTLTLKIR